MSTALVVPAGLQIPQEFRAAAAAALQDNANAGAGIESAAFAQIKIDGSKFFMKDEGETVPIIDDKGLPVAQIEVVVIGANPSPKLSKTWYVAKIKQGEKGGEPQCSSEDGITPDSGVSAPQSSACATCEQNKFGSAISEFSGKQTKACKDSKTLVILPIEDLDFKPVQLKLPIMGTEPWKAYVAELDKQGVPVRWVVTGFRFDMTVSYPKPIPTFVRMLTPEEIKLVEVRSQEDETKRVASPRRFGVQKQAVGAAFVAAAAPVMAAIKFPVNADAPVAAPAGPVAPAAAPAPVAPAPIEVAPTQAPPHGAKAAGGFGKKNKKAAVADAAPAVQEAPQAVQEVGHRGVYAGTLPGTEAAVAASGGLDSPVGKAVFEAMGGKIAAPKVEVAPVDPYAGHPAHVKIAVEASGGLDSDAGKAVFAAMTGTTKLAPQPVEAKPAAPVAAPAAPVAGGDLQAALARALNRGK